MERWAGKNAIVTGAASGIGEAITASLLRNKLNVMAVDIDPTKLITAGLIWEAIEPRGKLCRRQCDVSIEDDLQSVFQFMETEWNGVDIMVNNAGVVDYTRVIDSDWETFERLLNINVLATSMCINRAVRSMRRRNVEGHIFNINRKRYVLFARIYVGAFYLDGETGKGKTWSMLLRPKQTSRLLALEVDSNKTSVQMAGATGDCLLKQFFVSRGSVLGHEIPSGFLSEIDGSNGWNLYPTCKHGTVALTHTVRRELAAIKAPIRITVSPRDVTPVFAAVKAFVSISPGLVGTNIADRSPRVAEALKKTPTLRPQDVADALIYALGARAEVQISELTIQRTGEL